MFPIATLLALACQRPKDADWSARIPARACQKTADAIEAEVHEFLSAAVQSWDGDAKAFIRDARAV